MGDRFSNSENLTHGSGGKPQPPADPPFESILFTTPRKCLPEMSRRLTINNENFDLGSDWHLPCEAGIVPFAVSALLSQRSSDVFICCGDLFDTRAGQDSSPLINELLLKLARRYSLVIYAPGNHDLRGRTSPWNDFAGNDRLIFPNGTTPRVISTEHNRILVGNLFYDLEFIDPKLLNLSKAELLECYCTLSDGQHLHFGSPENFSGFTRNLAAALRPEIDILITHVLPHPSLVTFRIEEMTEQHKAASSKHGLTFIKDSAGDEAGAIRHGISPEEFRRRWNLKSFLMGSNVLDHPDAAPKQGLVSVYGHNHRGGHSEMLNSHGVHVVLETHQPRISSKDEWFKILEVLE